MQLNFEKAVEVFKKVRFVREEVRTYCLAGDRPDLSIEDFKSVVSRMYELDITVEEVPYKLEYVRGMLLRYPNRALIYIGKDQSHDWKRFTAVKELCHIVNDEKEDWSPKGADTLTGLMAELSFEGKSEARKYERSEIFAELAAIEMLYPFDERKNDLAQQGSISYPRIANFYKLPEVIIKQSLEPARMSLAESVWQYV